jgi:hypothetical protein
MKPSPTPPAWQADDYWKEVVAVITCGKKLRPEHYLHNLTSEELDDLRGVLSLSGSFVELRLRCPKRRGGSTDGSPPNIGMLSEIAQAMRQVDELRQMECQNLLQERAESRASALGYNAQMTKTLLHIVAEETLKQRAAGTAGKYAYAAASLHLKAEKQFDSKKTDQQRALDYCLDEAQGFPEVQELFKAAFAALKQAKAGKG